MKEKFEATNTNEENTKDTPVIEIVSPVGAGGRKISEEVLKESENVLDKSNDAEKENGEKEKDEKKSPYVVGAKKNPDGSWDYSQAASWNGFNPNPEKSGEKNTEGEAEKEKKSEENSEKNPEAENEMTSEELLDEARDNYTIQYQDFLKKSRLARVKNFLGIEASQKSKTDDLIKAESIYSDAKSIYAKEELAGLKD